MQAEPDSSSSEPVHVPPVLSLQDYHETYEYSVRDPGGFWGGIAESFHWDSPWDQPVVSANFKASEGNVFSRWFAGGATNICYNCLDRHVAAGHGDQIAFYHEANNEEEELPHWTYAEVLAEVEKLGSALRARGVEKSDSVTIFMPMVPQLPIAMLACARIGAVHTVVFGGFSAEALAGRILDAQSRVIITSNGVMRGAKRIPLYETVDEAVRICDQFYLDLHDSAVLPVESVIVLERLQQETYPIQLVAGRDEWWHNVVAAAEPVCPVEWVEAEFPLFTLYTSGSTGRPKGVVHAVGGYMVFTAATSKYIFDLQDGDIFFCTADCGWITGHSYVAYGPMLNRATQVIFEGIPTHPDPGRYWRIIDKYQVSQLYTAPTAIRSLMRFGDAPVKATSRASLKLLASVGEPINPEAWRWYHAVVGDGRCPIMDTWWQTETGGIMISPLPFSGSPQKPGCAGLPFFGVQPALLSISGEELEAEAEGLLAVKATWPSVIREVLGDYRRLVSTYFSYDGYYISGDGARRDADGDYWITGRMDDVIKTSGHRLGSAQIESAVVLHPLVSEAAAVGIPHDIKGEGVYVYATLKEGTEGSAELENELKMQCRSEIGAFATPDFVHFAPALPKTRSGKIMRRILRKVAAKGRDVDKREFGDTSTLVDPSVVEELIRTHHDAAA